MGLYIGHDGASGFWGSNVFIRTHKPCVPTFLFRSTGIYLPRQFHDKAGTFIQFRFYVDSSAVQGNNLAAQAESDTRTVRFGGKFPLHYPIQGNGCRLSSAPQALPLSVTSAGYRLRGHSSEDSGRPVPSEVYQRSKPSLFLPPGNRRCFRQPIFSNPQRKHLLRYKS